ncbi:DUF1707 domain-containing protein [Actinomadura sp. GTD37]|uniref:DUF1707 SHOCT-like domain-containing protein n=1 Tax=Actinomadura sp. GTD37 TaxID=1778030 RepID=UPI0035C1D5DC
MNRNDYSTVTEDPPRPPWPYRHPHLFPVTILSGLLLVSTGLAFSIKIEVTVPLLLPLAGAASTYLLIHGGIRRRRADAQARARQRTEYGPPLGLRLKHALTGDDGDLIGRDERDAVLELLNERYATSHFDDEEFGRRHTVVLHARRRRELRAPLEGLTW